MVDYDVILGMDYLSPYHSSLDFFANIFTLVMPDIPLVVWKGSFSHMPTNIISYIKYRRLT